MSKSASCTQCEKTFNKPTQLLADQALRMHVGRKHTGVIDPNERQQRSDAPRQNGNGNLVAAGSRYHLGVVDTKVLVSFLREHHKEYATHQACFTAALEAIGLRDKLKNNSGAVARYFAKALNTRKVKRKYAVRQPQARSQASVVQEVKINFCPNCGCNIHAVATGIAMATHIKS